MLKSLDIRLAINLYRPRPLPFEAKKQAGRIKAAPGAIVRAVRNFINSALTRATQRTQRFIRWVRVRLYLDAPWSESMARLRELWTLPA